VPRAPSQANLPHAYTAAARTPGPSIVQFVPRFLRFVDARLSALNASLHWFHSPGQSELRRYDQWTGSLCGPFIKSTKG
jgi:hypothetical protein